MSWSGCEGSWVDAFGPDCEATRGTKHRSRKINPMEGINHLDLPAEAAFLEGIQSHLCGS